MMVASQDTIISVSKVRNYLGGRWVHEDLTFEVKRGEIVAIIGASGCGKTTLLRTILMLHQQNAGTVKVFDIDTLQSSYLELMSIRKRWGVMFQGSALFSSITLLENIIFPMNELTDLDECTKQELALLKIEQVGLELDAAFKFPAELSGGMKKRAALARAIALEPELVFLDELTAGLDPKSASALDDLILTLREQLGLTFVIVTHDLDTLWRVPDRVLFLGEGRVLAYMSMADLVKQTHPLIAYYFSGSQHRVYGGNDE